MPFGGLTHVGPTKRVLYGVKVERIHSPPRGVTRRRCDLLSNFFDHLLLLARLHTVQEARLVMLSGVCRRRL